MDAKTIGQSVAALLVAGLAAAPAGAHPPPPTATFTETVFITFTATATPSSTPSWTATRTPSNTPTNTRTPRATATFTSTAPPTRTSTRTPVSPRPLLSINNVSVQEGNSGDRIFKFIVSLSMPSTQVVTVQYSTRDGTAHAGTDYRASSGTLTFPAGRAGLILGI